VAAWKGTVCLVVPKHLSVSVLILLATLSYGAVRAD
jgi:hypothetical protein